MGSAAESTMALLLPPFHLIVGGGFARRLLAICASADGYEEVGLLQLPPRLSEAHRQDGPMKLEDAANPKSTGV